MGENRISPICANVLPEDAKFFCPQCISEMNWLDNVKDIPERKYSFDRMKLPPPLSKTPKWPNRIMAVLSIIAGLLIIIWWIPARFLWLFVDGVSELMWNAIMLPGVMGIAQIVSGLALWKA